MSEHKEPVISCNNCIEDLNLTTTQKPSVFCLLDSEGKEIMIVDQNNREIRVSDDYDINDAAKKVIEIIKRELNYLGEVNTP